MQASNANSASDRKALQAEVTQLVSEIDRVAKQSDFNGTKLLDGTFSSQLFQVGANAGQAIAIDKTIDAKAGSLGTSTFATGATAALAASTDGARFSGTVMGVDIGTVEVKAGATTADASKAVATAINAKIGEAGIYAEANADGTLKLSSVKEGKAVAAADIALMRSDYDATAKTWGTAGCGRHTAGTDTSANAEAGREHRARRPAGAGSGRQGPGCDQQHPRRPRCDPEPLHLGRGQPADPSENLSASRSRIGHRLRQETAELTRTQILQQAGTAMLAQANQVPQGVLSLLR